MQIVIVDLIEMKTYLITGGAGFIGSNFVKYVIDKWGDKARVIVLDSLTYAGNLRSIEDEIARDNVQFVHGDVGDQALVMRLLTLNDVDYIVNFAAESHVDRSITNPRLFLETNVLGTHNMLECARQAWKGREQGRKFLQISSSFFYFARILLKQ